MRLEQEQFDKLSQLDRIEYRQKERKIREHYSMGYGNIPMRWLVFLVAFTILIFDKLYLSSLKLLAFGISCLAVFCGFLYLFDILSFITQKKELNKLEQKYFDLNTKKK